MISAAVAATWLWIKGRAVGVSLSAVAPYIAALFFVAAAALGIWSILADAVDKAAKIERLETQVAGYEEKDRLAAEAAKVDAEESAIADAAFRSNARANGELHVYLSTLPRIPGCIDRGTVVRLRSLK